MAGQGTRRQGVLSVIGAGGGVAAGLMLAHLAGGWWHGRTDYAAAFDRDLAGAPADAALFTAFRTGFPTDYARFRAWTIDRLAHGAAPDDLRGEAFAFMRNFGLTHKAALAQAPHAALARWRDAQIGAVRALQADSAEACAHFVTNGLEQGDRPGAAALAAINAAATAQIDATAAGTAHPTPHGQPGPADFAALRTAVTAAGLTPADMAVAGAGAATTAPAAQRCRVGLALMTGIAGLPPEQADRLSAAALTSG